jgi:hemerythrin-like metal-binding protein
VEGFVWSNDLITGDKFIDLQHKKLFNYLNILIAAENNEEARSSIVTETIGGLIEYTVIHFEEEELVLERKKYSGLERHKKLHSAFAQQVVELKKRFDQGEEILNELIVFVQNWLIIHIKQEDMQALKIK